MSVRTAMLLVAGVFMAGCANQKPVLYPNQTLNQHGKQAGEQAVSACMQSARAHGLSYDKGRLVKRTVENGAIGAGGGAVAGAIYGNAARGAAAGAAGSAATGLLRGLFSSDHPAPVYRAYVNRCLRSQGYEPVGWN